MLKKNTKNASKRADSWKHRHARLQKGVTSIEYALVAALIAIAVFTAIGMAGTTVKAMWNDSATKIADAVAGVLGQ